MSNTPKHQWGDFNIPTQDKPLGNTFLVCPKCSASRKKSKLKSLGVNYEAKGWHCCHCEFAGSLWRGITNEGDPNTYQKGAGKPAKDYVKPVFEKRAEFPAYVKKLFKSRKISKKTLIENEIGYGKHYMPQLEKEANTIQFPFKKFGEVINIKFRGPKKSFSQTKGAEKIPYGFDNLANIGQVVHTVTDEKTKTIIEYRADYFVIVEGEMDYLSVWESGEKYVISAPDGAPNPNTQDMGTKLSWIESIEDKILKARIIILAVDNDAPGEKLKEELARRIGKEKCHVVEYPEGCKDLNDVLKDHGKEAVAKILSNSKPYPVSGIFRVQDLEGEIDNIFDHGITPGMATKWPGITEIFRVALGEFTTVTGYQGSGKSEVIEDLCVDLAMREGKRVGVFSPEHPTHIHMIRLAEKYTGKAMKINDGRFIDEKNVMSKAEWEDAKRFLDQHFFWIQKERGVNMTPETLIEKKKMLTLRHGCELFIDDPYNRMDHMRPKDMTIEEYISMFLEMYGEFHEMHNAHGFIIAHPKNPDISRDTKKGALMARVRDISGGAMWGNKSLNVVSIGREGIGQGTSASKHSPTIFMTQKIKFKWNGALERRELFFSTYNGRFHEK